MYRFKPKINEPDDVVELRFFFFVWDNPITHHLLGLAKVGLYATTSSLTYVERMCLKLV
jgi:hypothetical protein